MTSRKTVLHPARAHPSRSRDLPLSGQNGCRAGRLAPPSPFRHSNWRSGRFPSLPYPPAERFQCRRRTPRRGHNCLPETAPVRYNNPCRASSPLAGFEVTPGGGAQRLGQLRDESSYHRILTLGEIRRARDHCGRPDLGLLGADQYADHNIARLQSRSSDSSASRRRRDALSATARQLVFVSGIVQEPQSFSVRHQGFELLVIQQVDLFARMANPTD